MVIGGESSHRTFLPTTIEFWPDTTQDIGDLARNELLDMLVRTIVVEQLEIVALTQMSAPKL